MKEKKASAEWYIAATHWLTAGFAIPFVLTLVLSVPLIVLLSKYGNSNYLVGTVVALINILGIWLGVIYSSKYLDKTYIIKDANKIINLATLYLAVIGGGFRVYNIIHTGIFPYTDLGFLVGLVIFYMVSKKYVKNNYVSAPQPQSQVPVV
ncbi:hypothetical protein EPO17_02015 [Patescibacteria group bacterium]|nr:MAG: hypothetical protein EPO17_02015 [Patescibacteria group bacterium]